MNTENLGFSGYYSSWNDALSDCSGYDDEYILEKVLDSTLKVRNGEAVHERDSVLFDEIEYSWPLLAGIMWVAARSQGELNVVDFGGALGSTYFQNRKFLSRMPSIRWNVIEQPHFVAAGRLHISNDILKFYTSIEDCVSETTPNVMLFSGVLGYIPEPFSQLDAVSSQGIEHLILDRTAFSRELDHDVIRIQHVPEWIYKASYPARIFYEPKLMEYIGRLGYELIESFDALDGFDPDTYWRGHIFSKKPNE